MEKRFAQIISYIFHPVLMPTLAVVLLLNINTYLSYTITEAGKLAVYSIVFINTALIPVLMVYFQYRVGLVKSLKLEDPKDRTFPFLITSFFYFFCFYILKKNNLPPPVYFLMLASAIAVTAAWIINFFWKISIHCIGIAGIVGMLMGLSETLDVQLLPVLFLFILFSGLVAFARLRLNAHTHAQIYSGLLLGFLLMYISLLISLA